MPNWASEASPTLGCSIEISRDIYVSVCMCWYAKVRRQNYMAQKCACSKSSFGQLKPTCETHVFHLDYWTKKKRLLRNEKLKASRASETEEQRKERLRI